MITFLQQSRVDKNSFIGTDSPEKATHFNKDGTLYEISELGDQQREVEENETIDDNILDLPSLDFSTPKHTESQTELKMHETQVVGAEDELLDLPRW